MCIKCFVRCICCSPTIWLLLFTRFIINSSVRGTYSLSINVHVQNSGTQELLPRNFFRIWNREKVKKVQYWRQQICFIKDTCNRTCIRPLSSRKFRQQSFWGIGQNHVSFSFDGLLLHSGYKYNLPWGMIYVSGFQPGLPGERSTVYVNPPVQTCEQGFLKPLEYILGAPLQQKGWKPLIYVIDL